MDNDDSVRSSLFNQVSDGILSLHFDVQNPVHANVRDIEIRLRAKQETGIEHTGEQVWMGSILVGEYIIDQIITNNIHNSSELTVLELGSGTGVLSILLSYFMKEILCTDYSRELISLEQNNYLMQQDSHNNIQFFVLDLLSENALTAIPPRKDPIDIIVAGDILFDEFLTENLCHYLRYILPKNNCFCIIGGEYRYNFVLQGNRIADYEFERFQEFVCFQPFCWKHYSKEANSLGQCTPQNRCSCGHSLVARFVAIDSIPERCKNTRHSEDLYICIISAVYK